MLLRYTKAIHSYVGVIPTETVYGLARGAQNPQVIEKILQTKNRPSHHPVIVHVIF
jgi:L-threonylcarbamoyladenylate synthase